MRPDPPGWPGRGVIWATALVLAGGAGAMLAGGRAKPVTHTVTIDATSYQPARLAVHAGDTVVWVNKDLIPHTATARQGVRLRRPGGGASLRYVQGEGRDRLHLHLPSDDEGPAHGRVAAG